jgi:hypothetical protein
MSCNRTAPNRKNRAKPNFAFSALPAGKAICPLDAERREGDVQASVFAASPDQDEQGPVRSGHAAICQGKGTPSRGRGIPSSRYLWLSLSPELTRGRCRLPSQTLHNLRGRHFSIESGFRVRHPAQSISATEVAAARDTHVRALVPSLMALGIEPAIWKKDVGQYFYMRKGLTVAVISCISP